MPLVGVWRLKLDPKKELVGGDDPKWHFKQMGSLYKQIK